MHRAADNRSVASKIIAPAFVDVKKLEGITSYISQIGKQTEPIDSILLFLNMVEGVFKGAKAVVFLIDEEMQDCLLSIQNGRKQSYKKINFCKKMITAIFS
jgi:hypothetical protein